MSQPHKCPCCDGWGTRRVWNAAPEHLAYEEHTCAACDGSGVVWKPGTVYIPSVWTGDKSAGAEYTIYTGPPRPSPYEYLETK